MVSARVLIGATVAAVSVSAAAVPEFDPVLHQVSQLLKRQEPGTPEYNCHNTCGQAIRQGRFSGDARCTNDIFTTNYANCLICSGPDNYNIWTLYGNTLSTYGQSCGLSTTPASGKQPDIPEAIPAVEPGTAVTSSAAAVTSSSSAAPASSSSSSTAGAPASSTAAPAASSSASSASSPVSATSASVSAGTSSTVAATATATATSAAATSGGAAASGTTAVRGTGNITPSAAVPTTTPVQAGAVGGFSASMAATFAVVVLAAGAQLL